MSAANTVPRLMKGHTYRDHGHKLVYPAIAQVKYDEIRCDIRREANGIVFRSFADKPLYNLDRYADFWLRMFDAYNLDRLDTGIMINGSYGDTYRFVRSKKGVPADLEVKDVSFILFDLPGSLDQQTVRLTKLRMMADGFEEGYPRVWVPRTCLVRSEEEVAAVYNRATADGHEGLMLKATTGRYLLGKRSYDWLKMKPEETIDGVITAIIQAKSLEGEPLDRAGSVTLTMEDGSIADAAGIPHELGRALLANPQAYLGEWAEMVYMMRDRQGGYRHPRFKRLREAKA